MAEPVSQVTDLSLAAADSPITIARDTASTTGRDPVKISPLANDTGDHLTLDPFASDPHATFPQDGFITVKGSTVTYTPGAGFEGTDEFQYSVHDKAGNSDFGIISVDVADNPLPAGAVAPDRPADSFPGRHSKAVKLDVLHNDVSGDGSKLTDHRVQRAGPWHGGPQGQRVHLPRRQRLHGTRLLFLQGLQCDRPQQRGPGQPGRSAGRWRRWWRWRRRTDLAINDDSFNVKGDTDTASKSSRTTTASVGDRHGRCFARHGGDRPERPRITYTPDAGFTGTDSFPTRPRTERAEATATVDSPSRVAVVAAAVGETLAINDDSFNVKGNTDTTSRSSRTTTGRSCP